jgi:hypothetical protein
MDGSYASNQMEEILSMKIVNVFSNSLHERLILEPTSLKTFI